MYCRNCGTELKDSDNFCPKCGAKIDETNIVSSPNEKKKEDKLSTSLYLTCLCMPLAGFILNNVWKDDYPNKAKACSKASKIGVLIIGILAIIAVCVYCILLLTILKI